MAIKLSSNKIFILAHKIYNLSTINLIFNIAVEGFGIMRKYLTVYRLSICCCLFYYNLDLLSHISGQTPLIRASARKHEFIWSKSIKRKIYIGFNCKSFLCVSGIYCCAWCLRGFRIFADANIIFLFIRPDAAFVIAISKKEKICGASI